MKSVLKNLTLLLTIAISILLSSCDCLQQVSGTVLDADNGAPIEGVRVQKANRDYVRDQTDTDGRFTIEGISGGLWCPPMTVVLRKEGYETLTLDIDNGGDKTIRLKRKLEE